MRALSSKRAHIVSYQHACYSDFIAYFYLFNIYSYIINMYIMPCILYVSWRTIWQISILYSISRVERKTGVSRMVVFPQT